MAKIKRLNANPYQVLKARVEFSVESTDYLRVRLKIDYLLGRCFKNIEFSYRSFSITNVTEHRPRYIEKLPQNVKISFFMKNNVHRCDPCVSNPTEQMIGKKSENDHVISIRIKQMGSTSMSQR